MTAGSISAEVAYTTGTIDTSASASSVTATAGTIGGSIMSDRTVVTATGVSGNNVAAWTAGLAVTMPADALAEIYEGTVTTSIL